jgi:cell division protein FtsL
MKKFSLVAIILLLILSTAIIKNTTKQIEDELFTAKENIRVLKSEFENISLEYDYLSSAEKLLEYQSLYFEDELIQKNIKNIKIYNITKEKKIKDFKIIKE